MSIWEEIEVDQERGAARLVAAYADRLYRTAYRLCFNAATSEDLVFRTLTRAVTATGRTFADERAYFSWLCTILVNFHRQDLRLKGYNALVFSDAVPEVEADAPEGVGVALAGLDGEAAGVAEGRVRHRDVVAVVEEEERRDAEEVPVPARADIVDAAHI